MRFRRRESVNGGLVGFLTRTEFHAVRCHAAAALLLRLLVSQHNVGAAMDAEAFLGVLHLAASANRKGAFVALHVFD